MEENEKQAEVKKTQELSYLKIKRILDIVGSLLGIIAYSPAFLIFIYLIKQQSEGDVIFKERCYGKDKVPFDMMKFRTTRVDLPSNIPEHLIQDIEGYITKVGRFLVETGFEDLPQLINILKGEMSFVGPRPASINQNELVEAREKLGLNKLRPGFNGFAKMSGANEAVVSEEIYFDNMYLKNISFSSDMKIFFKKTQGIIESIKVENKKEEKDSDVVDYTFDKDFRNKHD